MTKPHSVLVEIPVRGTYQLTFDMLHEHMHHLLNWQVKTELLSEDIRHYRRTIAIFRAMMGATGQYEAKAKFDDLWNRVVALEKYYDL